MFCVFCDTGHDDDNYCQACAIELAPVLEWMAELSGDGSWQDFSAPMNDVFGPDIDRMRSFFAGAEMKWDILVEPKFGQRKGRIIRLQQPIFTKSVWPCET